jgi:hypothetical protein
VNYVFYKFTTINEIYDSSPHMYKNYFILLLIFNIFVFTNTLSPPPFRNPFGQARSDSSDRDSLKQLLLSFTVMDWARSGRALVS